MGWFRDMKLQTKLLLVFSLMILVGALGIGVTLYRVNALSASMNWMAQDSEQMAHLAEAQALLLAQQKALAEYAATGDSNYLLRYEEARYLAWEALGTSRAVAEAHYANDMVDFVNGISDEVLVYNLAVDPIFDLAVTTDEGRAAALDLIAGQDARAVSINAELNSFIYERSLLVQVDALDGRELSSSTLATGVVLLLAFTGLAAIAALTTNSIAEPIFNLTNAVVAFENKAYRPDMLADYVERKDEPGKLAQAVDHMAQSISAEAQRREALLNAANRFVPVSYLDFLHKDSIADINLGDHVSAEMAIMFTDIRSFSALSEKMTAAENFGFINDYLSRISPPIREHNGALVKFVGDGMMSVYPYGVQDAVEAAIGQLEVVARYNQERTAQGQPSTGLGVGLHIGAMMLGMVGEATRMQGDAFSDNVNLTSRIEGLNKFFGTNFILSQELYDRLPDPESISMRLLAKVQVKGRQTPITVYEVLAGDFTESDRLKQEMRQPFEQALQHYWTGALEQAKPLFEEVARCNPDDVSAAYYLEETQRALSEGKPADWTGVVVMVSK
jgi:adenylate cyclase